MGFSLVRLTGQWLKGDQTPETGTVVCALLTPLQNGNQYISAPIRVKLDANGAVSFLCPATDDVGTTPTGQAWNIYLYLSSRNEVITSSIPSSQSTVNINTQLPWDGPPPGTPEVNLGGVEIAGSPQAGYVLVATSPTTAVWQAPVVIPPDDDEPFVYRQEIPASSAVITHNLGFNPTIVTTTLAGEEIIGDIDYIDVNTVQISFSVPFSWIAIMT